MASSTVYNGEHSLTFFTFGGIKPPIKGGSQWSVDDSNSQRIIERKNTWTEWHLIPTSRLTVAEAGVSTNFIEIPGRGDPVDLTEYLTGKPVYGPRSGSWEFVIDNYHEYWESIRMRIVDFLHGKRLRVTLSDIPTRYYEGRFTVGNLEPGEDFSHVTINYVLDVYSYSTYSNMESWLWDPFNFDSDYTDSRELERRL